MWFSTDRARLERRLDAVSADLAALQKRIIELEGQDFALSELRRQARNAVRSLERAAANAQDAPRPSNGKGAKADLPLFPIDPPGPRRNY